MRKVYLDQYENLRILHDNVYRVIQDSNEQVIFQLLVGEPHISRIMKEMHNSIYSGHLGISKTYARIAQRFFWPGMRKQINKYVQECDRCQRVKSSKYAKAPLKPIRPTRPMEIITADLAGPLPMTARGNRYILVVCDHFSKFTQCYALKNQTAEDVARVLVNFMLLFGFADSILTDQGTNFQSQLLLDVYDVLDINRLRTSPYRPQTDGITERFNNTVKTMLAAYLEVNQNKWDEHLTKLTFAYNSAKHKTTGYTPYEVMFGRILNKSIVKMGIASMAS